MKIARRENSYIKKLRLFEKNSCDVKKSHLLKKNLAVKKSRLFLKNSAA